MKGVMKDAVLLFIITLVAGAALGLVYSVTKEPIRIANEQAANATYREVFPEADSFETTDELTKSVEGCAAELAANVEGKVSVQSVKQAKDAQGNVLGYVVDATSGDGYGGNVQISLGITNDRKITGIGFLSISETPGLGMKATEPAFKSQFSGKDASAALGLVKSDASESEIQGLSGASHTSGAVQEACNAAIWFVNTYCD